MNQQFLDDSKTIPIGSSQLKQCVDRWPRFNNLNWILIRSTPLSSDIIQGALGNCWLLSALALVAEKPELLRCVLSSSSSEFERTSKCRIQLFRDGHWHSIEVDDRLPTNHFGELVFSQAKRNQLFVPLIEKAMAKLYGGYQNLIGGHTSEGMTSLTGFPCEIIWLGSTKKDNEDWIKILSYHSAGFLLGASCGREYSSHNEKTDEKLDKWHYQQKGLLPNHAYSVLDVISLNHNFRLLKLRNPWGSLVWKGDWSDQSSKWTQLLRLRLIPEGAEEGIFWISYDDLCRYFEHIIICKIQLDWHQYEFFGRFPVSFNDSARWKVFELQLDCGLTEKNSATSFRAQLMATLFQNTGLAKSNLAIFLVCFELFPCNSSHVIGELVTSSVCNIQSAVTGECELTQGKKYLLGVFGFNQWNEPSNHLNQSKQHNYVLRLYCSKKLKVDAYQPNPSLLGDMLIQYAKTEGEMFHKSHSVSYQLKKNWAGLLSVVENHHSTQWLQVFMKLRFEENRNHHQLDHQVNKVSYSKADGVMLAINDGSRIECQMSMLDEKYLIGQGMERNFKNQSVKQQEAISSQNHNLIEKHCSSSRQSFDTDDFIPPGHCQLLNIITNRRPIRNKHLSIGMNFRFHSFRSEVYRESLIPKNFILYHQPDILDTYGLHCPRKIISN